VFAEQITNRTRMLETPLVLEAADPDNPPSAGALVATLLGGTALASLLEPRTRSTTTVYTLLGGNDGLRPTAEEYRGPADEDDDGVNESSGLASLEGIEEISIVAAPGLSFGSNRAEYRNQAAAATQAIITHCERMRYRVAVLDSGDDEGISDVRNNRALLDTTRAAFYYPWVRIVDPISREPIHVPPSGFVTGIYARNDIDRGVHKAPANEVVLGAIWLETLLNKSQQDVLNPLGINCLRYFENRGIRVWGARTLSSDPEWKYLNVRRYFAYLERSIEKSTQWAVFEPNGEALWANVRRAVEDFLFNEWKSERLAGTKPAEAFFVKCDRTTMTQNDLDNGRMICLIGVAPLYPAEFVIFRIGQWTADRPA
jgi:phage tail sheath protein FI